MPTTATTRALSRKKPSKPTAALPAALAKRAAAATSAKHTRLLREARAHLALISRRKKQITEAFYDIGEALAALKKREMIEALGRRTFAEVCERDAGISATMAQQLVEVATSMTRVDALAMGQKKSMAMVALAAATPEADTPAALFRRQKVTLPGGRSLVPRVASANEVARAATAIRQDRAKSSASGGAPRRGRSTTAEERQLAELLQRRLRKLGLERAVVTAVATKPGQGADLRFEHIPAAKVDVLKKGVGA